MIYGYKKIVILGDAGVGKTTYIRRILTGKFTKNYTATMGVDNNFIEWHTTKGDVQTDIFDISGQEIFSGYREYYIKNADGIIIMLDVTSKLTYKNAEKWIKLVKEYAPDTPIVLCGNKVDVANRKVQSYQLFDLRKKYDLLQHYNISAKSCYDYQMPFLELFRHFYGYGTLFTY